MLAGKCNLHFTESESNKSKSKKRGRKGWNSSKNAGKKTKATNAKLRAQYTKKPEMIELSKTSPHLKSVQQNNKRILADLSGNEESEPRRKAHKLSSEHKSPNAAKSAVILTPAKSPQVPKFHGLSSQKTGNEFDFIPASQLAMNL